LGVDVHVHVMSVDLPQDGCWRGDWDLLDEASWLCAHICQWVGHI
jgi:hypothetical protein